MKREMLDPKVYYYTDAIDNFDVFQQTLKELDEINVPNDFDVNVWNKWTSSNDKDFIYGETKTFDLNSIERVGGEVAEKSKYIYNAVIDTFTKVCKDYAESLGDFDEPRLFPVFNIKKYNAGMGMGAHFDQLDGDKTLRYSLVMYLNDDCEGGEISFQLKDYDGGWNSSEGWVHGAPAVDLDYDVSVANKSIDFGIKPKANSVVIFPADAPYFHTAHTVKSGFKYMVPGHWIHNDMNLNRSM
jgi:2OG-Fe(II) oxygenase superfamily